MTIGFALRAWTTAVVGGLFLPALVAASEFHMSVHGHDVAVEQTDDGQVLKVDGRDMLSDFYVFVDSIDEIDGVPVAIGSSSAGGNACGSAPFVLVLKDGAPPRLDGPIDTCREMGVTKQSDSLLFSTEAIPGYDSERWSWTPSEGFHQEESRAFVPDQSKGWADLATADPGHPADLFNYGEVAAVIDDLLGNDKPHFETLITGPGSGERIGALFVGTACMPHDCTEAAAFLAADTATRQVYLAWKPEGEKIVVRPPVKQWPKPVRGELRDWASQWK